MASYPTVVERPRNKLEAISAARCAFARRHFDEASALAADDLAAAETVRLEFAARTDKDLETNKRFGALFDRLKVPGADEAAVRVRRTIGLSETEKVKLSELAHGRSDPMQRLAAFRMTGGRAA